MKCNMRSQSFLLGAIFRKTCENRMMRFGILVCFVLILQFSNTARGQAQVYLLNDAGVVYSLNPATCQIAPVCTFQADFSFFSDVAYNASNGHLIGITYWGEIIDMDLANCQSNVLAAESVMSANSLVCRDGMLYIAVNDNGSIYQYDLSTGNITQIASVPSVAAGDLTFYNGQLLLAADNNHIYEIDVQNNNAVSDLGLISGLSNVFGVLTIFNPVDCTNQLIVTSFNDVYSLDPATMNTNPLCPGLPVGQIYGAASNTEAGVVPVSPDASFTPSAFSGCVPLTVTFTPDVSNTNYTYSWDFGNPNTTTDMSSQQSPQYTFTEAGTYTVQLEVSGETACGPMEDVQTIQIVVGTPPVLTVNSGSFCEGSSFNLQVAGANTYSWSPPTGLNSTTGANVLASPTQSTTYTVTGTTNGCSASVETEVVLLPAPVLELDYVAIICPDGSSAITASGADTYSWSPPTGLNITSGSQVVASPSESMVYTVTGTGLNGCETTANATITVEDVNVTITGGGNLCLGDPLNDSLVLNAAGLNNYSWSPGSGLNTTIGSTVYSRPDQDVTYTVSGTTVNGCYGEATVAVNVVPDFEIQVNAAEICPGEEALLEAHGADTYTWSPPNGLNTTTGSSVIASPTSTQMYTLTGEVDGCFESIETTVTVFDITGIHAWATPTVVYNSFPEVTFGTNTSGSISWSLEEEELSDQANFTHVFSEVPASYTIILETVTEHGCVVKIPVQITVLEDLLYYVPNAFTPDGDEFNNVFLPIITFGIDPANYELTIFDRWGELLFESHDTEIGWDGTYAGKYCKEGVYTWKLTLKSNHSDNKIVDVGSVSLLR